MTVHPGVLQVSPDRLAQLREGLSATQHRIRRAALAAGREPEEVTLVVVTKFFPAADVAALLGLGVTDIGESRHPEAPRKLSGLSGFSCLGGNLPHPVPTVHFIGQVQTNKAAAITGYADVVQSVDRPALVSALDAGARRHERTLDVLIQVGLDRAGERGGCAPDGLDHLAEAIAAAPSLRLRGLMAVAARGVPAGPQFEMLAELSAQLRANHPGADLISAGMSGDLEEAIAWGATHVRVGSAILGARPLRG